LAAIDAGGQVLEGRVADAVALNPLRSAVGQVDGQAVADDGGQGLGQADGVRQGMAAGAVVIRAGAGLLDEKLGRGV